MAKKNDLVIPDKMLTRADLTTYANHAKGVLTEKYSSLEAFVLVKQMELFVEELKEMLKEGAIAGMRAKEENVFGATVTTKRSVAYEYNAPTLAALDAQKKEVDTKLKAIKKLVEATGKYVDPETGLINTATKVKDGVMLVVSMPKGGSNGDF